MAAVALFGRAIEINPGNATYFINRGIALRRLERFTEALDNYDVVLRINPGNADALVKRGNTLQDLKRFDDALASYDRALAGKPDYSEAFNSRGVALRALKRFGEALASYDRALAIMPDYADALNKRGNVLCDLKRLDEALASYDRALAIVPDYADALNSRGNVLRDLKRFDEALRSYDRALAIKPDSPSALNNRANVLRDLGRFDDALDSLGMALALAPRFVEALNNRGNALQDLKRFDDALADYDYALQINPDYAEALNNRGNVLCQLKRFHEALSSYDRALEIIPDYAEALNNRGNALHALRRFVDALASYDRALLARPDDAGSLNNRGNALQALRRFEDAIASYDRALQIKPDYADALTNRGNALQRLERFDDALASYDRALAIKPDYAFLFGTRLFCKMNICSWQGAATDFVRLAEKIEAREKASEPFAVLASPLSAALQRKSSEIYVREKYPRRSVSPQIRGHYEHDRIRLGYFSTDFHNHPVAHLMAGLFERHDRTLFETIAFSFGVPTSDSMRVRLEKSFDRFIDVSALSDADVALMARNLEIDIAVDLNGLTQGGRTGVFALRAAPIQVGYLGYPGTVGADFIDYLIADSTVIPEHQQRHYTENIAYLPVSYLVTDSKRKIGDKRYTRAECALPKEGFVFCCFNNSYKITPEMFEIWMRLLNRVEGSVLWLSQRNDAGIRNLRLEAEARGIGSKRLVFAPFLTDAEDHLARLRLADCFLDTLPYNAHATATDALWAGLPVVTCLGKTLPGRVAASLLNAIGLAELIMEDLAAYEALAIELATKPRELRSLREKLAANRLTYPLFDTARFAKHIESAYMSMWTRHQAGLAPAHFTVERETVAVR